MSRRDHGVSDGDDAGRVASGSQRERWWPARIGSYEVLDRIGGGSTGVVLRCSQARTGGIFAVKVENGTGRGESAALRREFALLARLRDRHHGDIVRAVETGREQGRAWFAMEFVDGIALSALTRALFRRELPVQATLATSVAGDAAPPPSSGRRESGEPAFATLPTPFAARADGAPGAGAGRLDAVLALVAKLARALAGLHAEGIVHADLSPRNVLVGPDGSPAIVDFSSAFYVATAETAREIAQPELGLRGTPGYMAPEQLAGHPVDVRADLYALGCLLYELTTGKPPFAAESRAALVAQHLRVTPGAPSLHVDGVTPALDRLVLGLLEKESHLRIGHAEDLASELEALRERPSAPPPSAVRQRPSPLFRPRVAGREASSRELESRLRKAAGGHGGIVLVAGESGSGKTRHLNELSVLAERLGVEVVASRCAEPAAAENPAAVAARAPFEAMKPLLERVAEHARSESGRPLSARLGPELSVLAAYEPSLKELPEALAEPPVLPPELARKHVVSSLARTMLALSESRPLLLLLDDLQWSDDLTLELVRLVLAGALEPGRVLLAASYRPGDLDADRRQVLEGQSAALVSLGPLDGDAVRAIVKDMLASDTLPEGLGEFLFRHSHGNALLAAEYLRTMVGRGDLRRDGSRRWSFVEPDPAVVALPASLKEAVRLKLADVGEAAAELLERASVLRTGFTQELLEDPASGADAAATTTMLLQELESRRILEQVEPGRYRFTHEALRGGVERSLSPERRRALHRAAAERLSDGNEGRGEVVTDAELGNHLAEAGEPHRALRHFERAARRAAQAHAYVQAAELYRAALGQAEAVAAEPGRVAEVSVAELCESLGDMLQRCARHEEARKNYRRAGEAPECDRLRRARVLRKEGKSYWLVHQYDAALEALDRAERELGPLERLATVEERREWIETSQGRFWVHYFSRRVGAESAKLVERMAPVVEAAGTPQQKAMFYQCAAGDSMAREHYVYSEVAVAHARRAVECSSAEREPAEAADARFALGFALVQGSEVACAEAVEQFVRAIEIVERVGDATILARLLTYLAVAHRRLRAVADVRHAATRALAAAEAARLPPYVAAATACLSWVAALGGDRREAERLASDAHRSWSEGKHPFPFRRLSAFVLLGARLDAEDYAGAAPLLELLLAPEQQRLPAPLTDAIRRARDACATSDARHASEALGQALQLARQLGFD